MSTIKETGARVEGVDTGTVRLEVIAAQWEMFGRYPYGCGHRCTAVLSHEYLTKEAFSDLEEGQGRSSHNTFMSLLVEQGVIGAAFYVLLVAWSVVRLRQLRARFKHSTSVAAQMLPGIAAAIAAIFVGDMFVDLLKHEVRIWLIALVLVIGELPLRAEEPASEPGPTP